MVVHPGSGRISRVRPYSGILHRTLGFRLRGSHPVSPTVPGRSSTVESSGFEGPTTPRRSGVWALACSLATTRAISFDFFSPVTEMFQFTEYTFPRERDHKLLCLWGFPIRKSSAGSACLAADRSLSQLATSFIGMQSRGIRVMR